MLKDACIYEWEVEFNQTTRHYDQCQEYSHETQKRTKATIRLLADRYSEDVAEAWLKARFSTSKDAKMKVLSSTKHDLDGFLISR